jgi:hypothetical protein
MQLSFSVDFRKKSAAACFCHAGCKQDPDNWRGISLKQNLQLPLLSLVISSSVAPEHDICSTCDAQGGCGAILVL